MENYSKWAVWKLEDELERLSNDVQQIKTLAKHITEIRDEKLRRGETQKRPAGSVSMSSKPGLLERMGLKRPKPVPTRGPDQILQPAGIASAEKVGK